MNTQALDKLPKSSEIADVIAHNAAMNRKLQALARALRKLEEDQGQNFRGLAERIKRASEFLGPSTGEIINSDSLELPKIES